MINFVLVVKYRTHTNFFHCQQYEHQRAVMLDKILRHCDPPLNIILFGDPAVNDEINGVVFKTT